MVMKNKIKIHTYGDSHATHHGGWTKISIPNVQIITNHLGGKLAYSFGRDKQLFVNPIKVSDGDVVVFCMGEIDCRCHINKYEPKWRESIDNLVESYIDNVKRNTNNLNVTTSIFNVVPPLDRENPINFEAERGSGVPAEGSDEDRQRYTIYMNEKLKQYCELNGFIYFDVYDEYCDENGFIKRDLSDDNCHIKNPIHMKEFIINKIIK